MNITVLGAGLVGSAIIRDLAADRDFRVKAVDVDGERLQRLERQVPVQTVVADCSRTDEVKRLVEDADLVVNALPGFLGFQTFRAVIEAGKSLVDIAFFPEDPLTLDELARERGVVAIPDCGVAPGMSNVLVGYAAHRLERVNKVRIYVGGLPVVRRWPYEYQAVFSPADVIEEYTRPARLVEHGKVVVREALSEVELVDFPEIGTLEAFNTDGLRTLIHTIPAPDMREKTLRYPGHAEKMRLLRESGFFETEPIEIGGIKVRPREVTSRLLFPLWEMKEGDEDITVMRIVVEGEQAGRRILYRYELLDWYDSDTGIHSMARTTGYTATTTVRLLARGLYDRKGVSPPEFLGKDARCVEFLLAGLKEKHVVYREFVENL